MKETGRKEVFLERHVAKVGGSAAGRNGGWELKRVNSLCGVFYADSICNISQPLVILWPFQLHMKAVFVCGFPSMLCEFQTMCELPVMLSRFSSPLNKLFNMCDIIYIYMCVCADLYTCVYMYAYMHMYRLCLLYIYSYIQCGFGEKSVLKVYMLFIICVL